MDSFVGWVGGKRLLRKAICEHFPKEVAGAKGKTKAPFERYIEVFGGAAWVLFNKDKHAPFEVYNYANGELVNLFRCIKAHPHEMSREIDLNLISRERFNFYKEQDPAHLTDIQRAARFMYMIKYSFCANIKTFGANNHLLPTLEFMEQVAERLARVIIENKSYERVIKQYDRPSSLFYLDPPYFNTETFYNVNEALFTADDHEKLRDILASIKGKFILSYNDDEFLKSLYKSFKIHEISRINNMTTCTGKAKEFKELIITNY